MNDQDENRPLTRRERRLREMAEAGVVDEVVDAVDTSDAPVVETNTHAVEIDIPLFDEDGRMRSRREIRELRAQAEAALAAELGEVQAEPEVTAESEVEADTEVEAEAVVDTEAELEVVTEAEAAPDVVEDIVDAEAEPEEVVEELEVEDLDASVSEDTVAFDVMADQAEAELESIESETSPEESDVAETVGTVISDDAEVEEYAEVEENADAKEHEDFSVDSKEEPVTQAYSFPDIAPLDQGQSVFDDPAVRMMGSGEAAKKADTAPTGDFDDLISRAVAQEGATTTSSSALILPNMPDANGLSGPLGETGELFITGSIDLPKSLGETGGHAAIHDSVEIEPLDELGIRETIPADDSMAPVSASRAVSMRAGQGAMVSEATRDKSKVPVALIATGGVLVLGAAGLIIWAATSGLFG